VIIVLLGDDLNSKFCHLNQATEAASINKSSQKVCRFKNPQILRRNKLRQTLTLYAFGYIV
jgi:hypothetical protein